MVIYSWWVWFALALLSSARTGCQSLARNGYGGEKRSEPRREETATASPAPEAAPRPAQVHAALLILQLSGESRQDMVTSLGGLVTSPISCFLPSLTVLIPSPVSSFQGIRGQQEAEADGTLHLCGAKYNVPQTQLITNLVWVHHAPLLWVRNGQWCCHASLKWLTTITFCFPRWLFFPCHVISCKEMTREGRLWDGGQKANAVLFFVNCVKVTY